MKRLFIAILTAVALVTFTISLSRNRVDVNPVIAAARQDLNGMGVYTHILTLPRGKQAEYYATLTPAERASLWRTHLANSIAINEGLSRKQQDFIIEVMTLTTPELFDGSIESRSKVRAISPRLQELFDKQTAGDIFARMEPLGLRAVNKPECGCSIVSDWCFGGSCHLGGCSTIPFGCGLMWVEECNGRC